MRRYQIIAACVMFAGGVVMAVRGNSGSSSTQPGPPIALQEIHARGVEGRLGFRLGTKLHVSGRIVPNASRAKGDLDEPYFVRVESVEGKQLAEPVEYGARYFRLSTKIEKLKIGDHFTSQGYETGRYNDQVYADEPPFLRAHAGYQFEVHFHVFSARRIE